MRGATNRIAARMAVIASTVLAVFLALALGEWAVFYIAMFVFKSTGRDLSGPLMVLGIAWPGILMVLLWLALTKHQRRQRSKRGFEIVPTERNLP